MQELAKLHLFVLVVIRHVVVADQIGNTSGRNSCLKLVRLRNEPIAELATVAYALNSHALPVNPQVSSDCGAHPIQDVLPLVAVLIAEYGIRKFLAIGG